MLCDCRVRSNHFSSALPRIAVPQLAEPIARRTAIERRADNRRDGPIVDEQESGVGAAAEIEPGFIFKTWIEDGSASFRKRNGDIGLRTAPTTLVVFIEHDHRKTPNGVGGWQERC